MERAGLEPRGEERGGRRPRRKERSFPPPPRSARATKALELVLALLVGACIALFIASALS